MTLAVEQQKERKKELAKRLMEMNARKREERLAEDEDRLNQLQVIEEFYNDGEEDEFFRHLEANDFKSLEELQKSIAMLTNRIERIKQKISASNNSEEIIVEDKPSKVMKMEPMSNEDMQAWLLSVKRKVSLTLSRSLRF